MFQILTSSRKDLNDPVTAVSGILLFVQADPRYVAMVREYTVVYLVARISGFQDFSFASKVDFGGNEFRV